MSEDWTLEELTIRMNMMYRRVSIGCGGSRKKRRDVRAITNAEMLLDEYGKEYERLRGEL